MSRRGKLAGKIGIDETQKTRAAAWLRQRSRAVARPKVVKYLSWAFANRVAWRWANGGEVIPMRGLAIKGRRQNKPAKAVTDLMPSLYCNAGVSHSIQYFRSACARSALRT